MTTLPTLDDRTYAELANDARSLIPSIAATWTDHNPTDPGIMLVELFAWLVEIVLYRLDRVGDASYLTFLKLLRGSVPTADDGSPLPLADAIRKTLVDLRDRDRAVTTEDFEYLTIYKWPTTEAAGVLGTLGTVRRVSCIAEQTPATLPSAWKTPAPPAGQGHFTLVIVPDCLAGSRIDLPAFDYTRRYAVELDGKASYVDCGNDASLSITGALTVSAWVFPRDLSVSRRGIVSKAAAGEFELYVDSDGTLGFRHGDGTDGGATTTTKVQIGRWTHVAAVRDGKTLILYVDGKVAATTQLSGNATGSTANVVIGRQSSGSGFFDGFIRDVCIWNVARTEIDLGGDLQHAPPELGDTIPHGMVACWPLDAVASSVLAGGPVVTPDSATPPSALSRPRDGVPHAASWRDVVRPLQMSVPLHDGLATLLDERRLLTTHFDVIDQKPLRLKITANLYLRSDGTPETVRTAVKQTLDSFLDPLRGWQGNGWPFGRPIFVSDVTTALDGTAGIDFVEAVSIDIVNDTDAARQPPPTDDNNHRIGVRLQPYELPILDTLQLTIYQRKGTQWQPA